MFRIKILFPIHASANIAVAHMGTDMPVSFCAAPGVSPECAP